MEPGTAGAFGPIMESFGTPGATMVAMATATYALIAGSIIAGPICKRLIEKKNLIQKRVTLEEFQSFDDKSVTLELKMLSLLDFKLLLLWE